MENESINVSYAPSLTLSQYYNAWLEAQAELEKTPTYYNSVRVQIARREYDVAANKERVFVVVDGGKGVDIVPVIDIMTNALREVVARGKAVDLLHGPIMKAVSGSIDFEPFRYIYQVAEKALDEVGLHG